MSRQSPNGKICAHSCSLVVTCWECVRSWLSCKRCFLVYCHFPICVWGQVWHLIVLIPDSCLLQYFKLVCLYYIFLFTYKNVLVNPLFPYKSVSNVSSHREYISCIISWRNSLKLLHSNKKCLVVSFLPHMHNGLYMLFFKYILWCHLAKSSKYIIGIIFWDMLKIKIICLVISLVFYLACQTRFCMDGTINIRTEPIYQEKKESNLSAAVTYFCKDSLSLLPIQHVQVKNYYLSVTGESMATLKYCYTTARVFVLRIRVLCAFPTRCTCVEFKLRMKRESTYFETHEYS